jgi:hypothetical protein
VYPDGRRVPVHDDQLSALTMISEWVGSGPEEVAIFRDPLTDGTAPQEFARMSDLYKALGGWVTRYESECYIVIPPLASREEELLRRVVLGLPSWMHIGFLSRSKGLVSGSAELAGHDLVRLADGLEAVIIGAYDGEGYVVWSRTKGDHWLLG